MNVKFSGHRTMPKPGSLRSLSQEDNRSHTMPHNQLKHVSSMQHTHSSDDDVSPVRHSRTRSSISAMPRNAPSQQSTPDMISGQERRRDSYAVANIRLAAHRSSRANTQLTKEIAERDRKVMERVQTVQQLISGKKPKKKVEILNPTIADTVVALSAEISAHDNPQTTVEGLKAGGEVRGWIEDKREATRRAVIQRSAVEAADAKARNQAKAHAEVVRRLEIRLAAAEDDANAARRSETEAREAAARERDKCLAAEHVATLLRSRLRQLASRRMETERKLVVFERFLPLFDVLSERYDFSVSAEGLISRLEVLERAQVELLSDLMSSQERCTSLEKEIAAKEREWEDERQRLSTEYTKSQEKIERRGEELEMSMRGTEDDIVALNNKVERAARLESALRDLWSAVMPAEWVEWEKEEANQRESVIVEDDDDDLAALRSALLPEISTNEIKYPEQIVSALTLVLTMRHPERRETSLRKLSGLGHRVWLKWYSEMPELKSRPYATFEKLYNDYEGALHNINSLEREVKEGRVEKKALLDSLPASDPRKSGRIPARTPKRRARRPETHLGFV